MKKYYIYILILFFIDTQCMEPPGKEPTILFKDRESKDTVTVLTHNNAFGYQVDRKKLQQSETLSSLLEKSDTETQPVHLSQEIYMPYTTALLLHHLNYTDEESREKSIAKCSGNLITWLTNLTNFLNIQSLLNAYTQRACTLVTELSGDKLNDHLSDVQCIHPDLHEIVKKSARELKIHLYWLGKLYPGFFLQQQPPALPKMGSYKKVTDSGTRLCEGDTKHIDCKELEKFPEFLYMRDNLSVDQYLLLFLVKAHHEQKQPFDLEEYPTLQQAYNDLKNQKLKDVLTNS